MSWVKAEDPYCQYQDCPEHMENIIVPRTGDIGNFQVRRALPSRERRMVGPFIFWDQMGPGEFLAGEGVDVRPHPHIGLATITYLFDGSIVHRDSLGVEKTIVPGDVNIMTAGSGIAHSERTGKDVRRKGSRLFGIQSWIALPSDKEETDPGFTHHGSGELPVISDEGKDIRIIAGALFGHSSPAELLSETIYADIRMKKNSTLPVPVEYEERAVYPIAGRLEIGGTTYDPMQLLVFKPNDAITIRAADDCRFMLLGGAAADGPRHIWWNFVSSRKERIEQAKHDWKNRKFKPVPGDSDFIPLPEY